MAHKVNRLHTQPFTSSEIRTITAAAADPTAAAASRYGLRHATSIILSRPARSVDRHQCGHAYVQAIFIACIFAIPVDAWRGDS